MLSDFRPHRTGGSALCRCSDNRDLDQFSSANFVSWQFSRALVEVGTDLSFAVAYADAVAVTVQLGLPWCVKVADIIFDVCRVFQRIMTLPDNSDLLCRPLSVLKAIGQRVFRA